MNPVKNKKQNLIKVWFGIWTEKEWKNDLSS